MIFFKGTIYAKVWKVTPGEKFIDLRMSTSEKKDDGSYVSSNWFPRVIGHAFNSLKGVKEGDRICITKCKFTNETYKAADGSLKSSFRFLILEATIETSTSTADQKPAEEQSVPTASPTDEQTAEEDSPW